VGGFNPAAPPPWVRQWSLLILFIAVRVVNVAVRVVNTAVVSKYGGTGSKVRLQGPTPLLFVNFNVYSILKGLGWRSG
jgi:hypothetical protein